MSGDGSGFPSGFAAARPGERPLVGRARERAEIDRARAEALSGRGRLVVLAGEPGIGKTRLADEATVAAAAAGMPVLWGRCWEDGGAPAYLPWIAPLAAVARALDDEPLRAALGDAAGLVAGLLPEVGARLGSGSAAAAPSPAEARFRLWRALTELLRAGAARAGLVLVLEDLHAADEPSLLFLYYLARELRGLRLLLLASFRDVEASVTAAQAELLERIAREGQRLRLGRLAPGATDEYLEARLGPLAPELSARIHAQSQGNPLFLDEMARACEEQGPAAIAAGEIPPGIRAALARRVRRLPDHARPVVALAAVAGDATDASLLAEAAGLELAAVKAALGAAVGAAVLAERSGGLGFSHALVREAIEDELPGAERQLLHGALAAALLRRAQATGAEPPPELAHHLLAGPPAGLAQAIEYGLAAAERALRLLAYEAAIALIERVRDAAAAGGAAPAELARILLALGEAQIRSGHAEAGKTLCREVAGRARALGDAELLARAAVTYGLVFTFAATDPILVGLLEEALEALPAEASALRARLLGRLAGALTPSDDLDESIAAAREAIAIARRLGDPAVMLTTTFSALAALMDVVEPPERIALNLEVEQLALRAGDRERLLRTHARLVTDYMEMGQFAEADARIEAYAALSAELGAPWLAWRGLALRAMRAMAVGRWDEARAQLAAARVMGEADPDAALCLGRQHEALLRAHERHDEMVAYDPTARSARAGVFRASASQAAASALLHARREDAERTAFYLGLVDPAPVVGNVYAIFFVAEPIALVGSEAAAARLYDMLAPAGHRDVMLGITVLSWEGPVARLLALLAARLGRWDAALAHFAAARARAQRLGTRPVLARIDYEEARALATRGRPEDADRARALFQAAHAAAVELDMPGLAALAARRLERRVAPRAGFQLAREGEYWAVQHGDATFRLKDSLGLGYLARLVAEPGREIHCLDLAAGRAEGEAVDVGDAGELLDDEARARYQARLEDLREIAREAESFGDSTKAARANAEIEALAAELGRAVGLGGRARRAGAASERARIAVQRRIKNALERIAEHDAALAATLAGAVRTGNFCVYRP